ncbi:hypothetical protein NE237_007408 [Protea cynaroides]|uniref:Uncharacterized protein n=1 Tax=Protea cynaroides TaxID=273540 RepID=A0A9Q0QWG6_9MAGN|nr:hypothetical protein NE237_007408 [Protea cynaroides]
MQRDSTESGALIWEKFPCRELSHAWKRKPCLGFWNVHPTGLCINSDCLVACPATGPDDWTVQPVRLDNFDTSVGLDSRVQTVGATVSKEPTMVDHSGNVNGPPMDLGRSKDNLAGGGALNQTGGALQVLNFSPGGGFPGVGITTEVETGAAVTRSKVSDGGPGGGTNSGKSTLDIGRFLGFPSMESHQSKSGINEDSGEYNVDRNPFTREERLPFEKNEGGLTRFDNRRDVQSAAGGQSIFCLGSFRAA